MGELVESIQEAAEHAHGHPHSLNSRVGVAVAVTATVMALTNIVGGEGVQEMNLTASEVNNTWAYFQAKSTKQHLAETSLNLLEAQGELAPQGAAILQPRLERYRAEVQRYEKEKTEIQEKARGARGAPGNASGSRRALPHGRSGLLSLPCPLRPHRPHPKAVAALLGPRLWPGRPVGGGLGRLLFGASAPKHQPEGRGLGPPR